VGDSYGADPSAGVGAHQGAQWQRTPSLATKHCQCVRHGSKSESQRLRWAISSHSGARRKSRIWRSKRGTGRLRLSVTISASSLDRIIDSKGARGLLGTFRGWSELSEGRTVGSRGASADCWPLTIAGGSADHPALARATSLIGHLQINRGSNANSNSRDRLGAPSGLRSGARPIWRSCRSARCSDRRKRCSGTVTRGPSTPA
jgi:hypothetical protein